MQKRHISLIVCTFLILSLLAGCGKISSMKNYRSYAVSIVQASTADEETKKSMIDEINHWKKEKDFDDFYSLLSLVTGGYIKTYDAWVTAGCPTPSPTPASSYTQPAAGNPNSGAQVQGVSTAGVKK